MRDAAVPPDRGVEFHDAPAAGRADQQVALRGPGFHPGARDARPHPCRPPIRHLQPPRRGECPAALTRRDNQIDPRLSRHRRGGRRARRGRDSRRAHRPPARRRCQSGTHHQREPAGTHLPSPPRSRAKSHRKCEAVLFLAKMDRPAALVSAMSFAAALRACGAGGSSWPGAAASVQLRHPVRLMGRFLVGRAGRHIFCPFSGGEGTSKASARARPRCRLKNRCASPFWTRSHSAQALPVAALEAIPAGAGWSR